MNTFADTEICSNTAEVAFAFNLVSNTDLFQIFNFISTKGYQLIYFSQYLSLTMIWCDTCRPNLHNLINSRKETYRWQETNSTLSIWNAIHPWNNWGQQSSQGSPQEISLSLIIIGSTIICALCVGWQKHQTQNYSKLKSSQQYYWMEYFFWDSVPQFHH